MAPESGYDFIYDWYKDHADVHQFAKIYSLKDHEVGEMVFTDIRITGEDYEFSAAVPDVILKTSSTEDHSAELPDEKIIYDDHGVIIMCRRDEEGEYLLWIANQADANYSVKTSNMRINGASEDCSGLYNQPVPAHYLCPTHAIYSFDRSLMADSGTLVEMSFEFSCAADPAMNFATGYLTLNPLE